jgi:hypothetical protein
VKIPARPEESPARRGFYLRAYTSDATPRTAPILIMKILISSWWVFKDCMDYFWLSAAFGESD